MHYTFTAISGSETPRAAEPVWQHVVDTYVSECNKTASMWRAVPDDCLEFRPHEKVNTIRAIFEHQLLSERRFFAEFVGIEEPPTDQLLPQADIGCLGQRQQPTPQPRVSDYIDKYIHLSKLRLPQLAAGTTEWWLTERPFFDGLTRQRIWIFWRRVLHTCHHRTQVQSWLRLAGQHVPAIYGPSGDEKSAADDPTYSVAAASRGASGGRGSRRANESDAGSAGASPSQAETSSSQKE
jgi:uncharacterized damage-inducible protein DinB